MKATRRLVAAAAAWSPASTAAASEAAIGAAAVSCWASASSCPAACRDLNPSCEHQRKRPPAANTTHPLRMLATHRGNMTTMILMLVLIPVTQV